MGVRGCGKTVIKSVHPAKVSTAGITELEALRRTNTHPNIVRLLGFHLVSDTGALELTLEAHHAGDLDHRIQYLKAIGQRFTETQVYACLIDMCQALSWVHSLGMVHRDIVGFLLFEDPR
jgi:serine/threonine protein kinase